MSRASLGFGVVAVFVLPAAVQAQTRVSEVVVTAAPFPVSLDSVTSHVEILTRDQLDLAPPAGLGDILATSPGLRSSAYGPGASRPIVRGLAGARVLVLENGVGMIDASTLSPDHAVASDAGEASRIEVLRGPSALAYGGSGVGGVVNVIDERIASKPAADGLDGRVSVSAGSGDDSAALSAAVKAGRGPWVLSGDVTRRKSEDYRVPGPPVTRRFAEANGVEPADDNRQRNTEVDLTAYGVGLSYVLGDRYYGAAIKHTETTYGLPYAQVTGGGIGEGPVAIDLKQTRVDLHLEGPAAVGPFGRLRLAIGAASYEHVEQDAVTGEAGTRFQSDGVEARAELIQNAHAGHDGAVGLQALTRDLQAIGDEAFIPSVTVREVGVFTLQRWTQGRYGLDAGLRIDRRELKTAHLTRRFENLSASAGASFRPADPWFLALSASYNSRAPTEFELFANGPHAGTGAFEIGDADLDPEKVASLEATIRYTADRWRVEGHLFAARYDGFIEERPTGDLEDGLPVFAFEQGDADFHGFEVESGFDLWRGAGRTLTLEADADYVRGSTDQGPPPRIPPWSVTTRLIYAADRYSVTGEVRHVAEQDRVAAFETPTPDYTLVNLRGEYRPPAWAGVRLFAEGRNLTDAEAREHASFLKEISLQPGRTIRVGAAATF
jgi:iron complex outermembrane receptor protein